MAHRNSTDTYRGNFNDDNDEIVVVLLTNSGGIVGGRIYVELEAQSPFLITIANREYTRLRIADLSPFFL